MKKLLCLLSCFALVITMCNAQQKVWQKSEGYQIRQIVTTNNKVFYCSYDDGKLFVTTGNQNSALLLGEFYEIPTMVVFGNNVVFVGRKADGSNLWITDGTVSGTKIIENTAGLYYSALTVFNNKLYFTNGGSIYYLNAAQTAAELLLEIPQTPPMYSDIQYLRKLGNKLIYLYQGSLGITDGSSSEINFLSGIENASVVSEVLNDKLFFINGKDGGGFNLWSTDGTDANTALFKDINMGYTITGSNGKLYFTADAGSGSTVWVTDGTLNGTSELNMGASYTSPEFLKSIDGNVYFRNNAGTDFYFSDGLNNTVQNIGGTQNPNYAYGYIKFDGHIYFVARNADYGYELWRTDNTASSTTRVTDICSGTCDAFNSYTGLTVCGNILFFSAGDFSLFSSSGTPYQLWKLSGSSTTTAVEVADNPKMNGYPNPCKDYVSVECQQAVSSVQLFSVVGMELNVNWQQDKNTLLIKTQDLHTGMYLLLIDGKETVHIIKE